MGALSEFERDLIIERTRAGIRAAKARGVTVGRPRSMSHEQVQHAKTLVEGGEPKRKVARLFKVIYGDTLSSPSGMNVRR